MDPPTTGREPRPPSHVSAAATCHALPGLGSVMERSLSVGEGKGARELHGVEVTQQSRSSLGPDLKVWSGSLKKGMHCPAPKRPEPPRGRPSPPGSEAPVWRRKSPAAGQESCSPPKLADPFSGESQLFRNVPSAPTPQAPTDGAGVTSLLYAVPVASVHLHCANESGGVGVREPLLLTTHPRVGKEPSHEAACHFSHREMPTAGHFLGILEAPVQAPLSHSLIHTKKGGGVAIGGTHTLNPSLEHECAPRGTGRQITESAQQFAGQPDCTTTCLPLK